MRYNTINNSQITLGDIDDLTQGRHFKSRFIQPGLAGYPGQYGNALIRKETLDKFIQTLVNKPVIINHKEEITEKDKVGKVLNVWFNADDGWYWCDGIIYDEEAQKLINNGWNVSCSYNYTDSAAGGTENNVPYDIEFLDGEFDHLAIVENPRYERANIVFNNKLNNTFEGHAGRKGQVGGSLPRKYSLPTIEDYENPTKDYELPNIPDKFLEKLGKKQKPLFLKQNIIEKNKNNHKEVPIEEYNNILEKGIYKANLFIKTKPNDDYFNFVHYGNNKHEHVLIELSETKEHYEIVSFHWLNDDTLEEKEKNAIKRVDNEDGQFLIDIEDKTSMVGVLSNLEIDSISIIPLSDRLLNPKNEKFNKVNNSFNAMFDDIFAQALTEVILENIEVK